MQLMKRVIAAALSLSVLLGLSLAAKIIELHGGKLKIQSEVDIGTCMQVFFREVPADAS